MKVVLKQVCSRRVISEETVGMNVYRRVRKGKGRNKRTPLNCGRLRDLDNRRGVLLQVRSLSTLTRGRGSSPGSISPHVICKPLIYLLSKVVTSI